MTHRKRNKAVVIEQCPVCGRDVSSWAAVCAGCGHPLGYAATEIATMWVIVSMVLAVLCFWYGIMSSSVHAGTLGLALLLAAGMFSVVKTLVRKAAGYR